jgi:L-histidine N-alpha-methyltransferase
LLCLTRHGDGAIFTKLMDRKGSQKMTLQQNKEVGEFANDVAICLASENRCLNPKYLYDNVGSQLFEQICLQPEYYPTRTEASLLERYAPVITNLVGSNIRIIELGSGSSSKTSILLRYLSSQNKRIYYFPIDISSSILTESTKRLKSQFPDASIIGIRSDYNTGIDVAAVKCMVANAEEEKKMNHRSNNYNSYQYAKLILFLGSSIGNFEPIAAASFLRSIRQKLRTKDFLLVGFDLQKDESVLYAAYNDKAGITAKFNLNLLARINRDLGGNFELGKFKHYAFYNREQHRIEMHLVSTIDQQVYVETLGKNFSFRKGNSIHTENSYKYSLDQIAALAMDSGFRIEKDFTDERRWFNMVLLSPS